jgi:hypothetical protein
MTRERKIPDLLQWDLAPETVLMPDRILQYQAALINQKSGGRLRGEVERVETDKSVTLNFLVMAPSLEYSVRLFYCSYQKALPYPTKVYFEDFVYAKVASRESEFRDLVEIVFGSDHTRSIFESLLARVGDVADDATGIKSLDEPDAGSAPLDESA